MGTPAFSSIDGTSFVHVYDGRSRTMRVRVTERKNGTLTVAKFATNRNLKLGAVELDSEETQKFQTFSNMQKAQYLFRVLG